MQGDVHEPRCLKTGDKNYNHTEQTKSYRPFYLLENTCKYRFTNAKNEKKMYCIKIF